MAAVKTDGRDHQIYFLAVFFFFFLRGTINLKPPPSLPALCQADFHVILEIAAAAARGSAFLRAA
jgi:hypothetical protein